MSLTELNVGFIALVDAAPLIVAQELRFAAEEGLSLNLMRAPSWSSLRDMLAFGRVEAAHMLSAVPVATALGLGGAAAPLAAVSVLSLNGDVIGVSSELAEKMRAAGHPFDFADATAAGRALINAVKAPLRIGVPFPFSMHAELLYYWLASLGFPAPQNIAIRTVPPPLMAQAMAAGEIDAFCVGEPWGSIAVDTGVGALLLPGNAIWAAAPEKVLALRSDWCEAEPEITARLIRATWRAGRWLADPTRRTIAAELLSRACYLDVPAELIERALSGQIVIDPQGEERRVDRFVEFHEGAATFPWRSQAAWIGRQLASRTGLDRAAAMTAARRAFRPDIYRYAMQNTGADIPGASDKIEGTLDVQSPAASTEGGLFLGPDRFFDGSTFDPDRDQ